MELYEWRCSLWLKKITILDDGYGRVVYSILENDNQSVSFYLSSCTPKHETLENYSTSFLYQILWLFCFYFLILFLLLLHAYVCEIPCSFTHPLTRCPKNEKKGMKSKRNPKGDKWKKSFGIAEVFVTWLNSYSCRTPLERKILILLLFYKLAEWPLQISSWIICVEVNSSYGAGSIPRANLVVFFWE